MLLAYLAINAFAIVMAYAAAPGASVASVVVGSAVSIGLDLWPAFVATTLLVALWVALHRVLAQRPGVKFEVQHLL
jgi:hypothetical protein